MSGFSRIDKHEETLDFDFTSAGAPEGAATARFQGFAGPKFSSSDI